MYEFTRVENLNGDLTSIRSRLKECRNNAQEITEMARTRILADKKSADRRAEELMEEINSTEMSELKKRIKQSEIDAISHRRYEPTEIEKAEFEQAILEYNAALNDLKDKQNELKEAIKAAKRCLDDIRADMYVDADPVLIERYIDSEKARFNEITIYEEAKQ